MTTAAPRLHHRVVAARRSLTLPRAALVCGAVAFLSALTWSLIVPAFQAPDEQQHFAYVQHLAETGALPKDQAKTVYSPELATALRDLRFERIQFDPLVGVRWSAADDRRLHRDLDAETRRRGNGDVGLVMPHPPLFYGIEAIPYLAASQGSLLDRLALMRVVASLLAGATAALAYLFIREALPGASWAWMVGGLAVALQPLFGHISGSVNPDSLLFAMAAALLYCLARAFRRGLSPGLAVAIGGVIGMGMLSKLNFVGLVPAAVIGLVAAALHERRGSVAAGLRLPAMSLAVAAIPMALGIALNVATGRPAIPSNTYGDIYMAAAMADRGTISGLLGFSWEFYLFGDLFPGVSQSWHGIWLASFVSQFGWVDTRFPDTVTDLALVPTAIGLLLAARTIAAHWEDLRARLAEASTWLVAVLGVAGMVAATAYPLWLSHSGGAAQARYLLPLLPLYGGVLTLAARGAGARFGPAVGVLIVVTALGHDIFSQLLAISRYYG
jgi:4-amino-4-deoxy-L-arabinose transferase-like glycosyltransferase